MEIDPLQAGGAFGVIYALIELLKFVIGKYTSRPENGNGSKKDGDIEWIKASLNRIEESNYQSIVEMNKKFEMQGIAIDRLEKLVTKLMIKNKVYE